MSSYEFPWIREAILTGDIETALQRNHVSLLTGSSYIRYYILTHIYHNEWNQIVCKEELVSLGAACYHHQSDETGYKELSNQKSTILRVLYITTYVS